MAFIAPSQESLRGAWRLCVAPTKGLTESPPRKRSNDTITAHIMGYLLSIRLGGQH